MIMRRGAGAAGGFGAVLHDHAARAGGSAGDSVRCCMMMQRGSTSTRTRGFAAPPGRRMRQRGSASTRTRGFAAPPGRLMRQRGSASTRTRGFAAPPGRRMRQRGSASTRTRGFAAPPGRLMRQRGSASMRNPGLRHLQGAACGSAGAPQRAPCPKKTATLRTSPRKAGPPGELRCGREARIPPQT